MQQARERTRRSEESIREAQPRVQTTHGRDERLEEQRGQGQGDG